MTEQERKIKIKNIIRMFKELESEFGNEREQVPKTQAVDCVRERKESNFGENVRL